MTPAAKLVLVAPDKFAGTLTADEAAKAIASGWSSVRPNDVIDQCPLADGGPGFLDVVAACVVGTTSTTTVTGPDGAPVTARMFLGAEADRRTVYLEAADACGLHLAPSSRRPLTMTTSGVADLLHEATQTGADRIVIGVGGTATTDGGAGLVQRWADRVGPWPPTVELVAAADVLVPLLGDLGAARAFARQKGASAADVERLEQRLLDWVRTAGGDPDQPGAGAGGGLGFGISLLGGRLESGGALVARLADLPTRAAASAVVVTGEGRLDATSLVGKVVGVVAATNPRPPTWALVGSDALSPDRRRAVGLRVASLTDRFGPEAAREEPAARLAGLAAELASGFPGPPCERSADPPG